MIWMIYIMSMLKGISYGFTIFIVLISYSYAGWLVVLLLMFSVLSSQVPLFFFWVRHINRSLNHLMADMIFCLVATSLIGIMDYFVISPLCMNVLR